MSEHGRTVRIRSGMDIMSLKPAGLHPLTVKRGTVLCQDIGEYPDGLVIPVDKPYRWTSADVIRKIKFTAARYFHKKNLKVGHAGTLDPLATGVLLVCVGKATKLAETLQSHDKEYVAGITFGATTPSYDREKDIDRLFPHGHITENMLRDALAGFIGEQDQVAPLFSAKSVDGVRAYEIARRMMKEGGAASLDETASGLIRTSSIRIDSAELLSFVPGDGVCVKDPCFPGPDCAGAVGEDVPAADGGPGPGGRNASSRINVSENPDPGFTRAVVRITCSKGTYIRAFARDLGEAVGSGAFLDSLQRSRSGDFSVADALSMDEILSILSLN